MYILCLSKGVGALKQTLDEGLLPNKKLAFIPTAGETYKNPYFVEESRNYLLALGLELIEVDVSSHDHETLLATIRSADGIYVAGGNSFYLIKQLRAKGLIADIRQLVLNGMPYFGESAGAVILYKSIEPIKPIDDPQDVPGMTDYDALGLIDFIPLPHIDREKYKDLMASFLAVNKDKYPIVPYGDKQAILIRDDALPQIVDSQL